MKIPHDALIDAKKLTNYLLVFREQDDKSKFLAQAGFTRENSTELEVALRRLISAVDAEVDDENIYGVFYLVRGDLVGIEERILSVITVWMQEKATGNFRFITLKPWRKGEGND